MQSTLDPKGTLSEEDLLLGEQLTAAALIDSQPKTMDRG
jgi:hypothetical protein